MIALADVLAAGERAAAAYLITPLESRAAFEQLGLRWHGLYQQEGLQAVLSSDVAGRVFLSISGTRFEDRKISDLLDDLDTRWVDVGLGAEVLRGAYDGLQELWTWAKAQVATETAWYVEGHSLGGWRARYTPLFVGEDQIAQIVSFESPKSANAAFYERFKEVFSTVYAGVVNGSDIFVGYPWTSTEACHPPYQWHHLLSGPPWLQMEDPANWPGGLNYEDHSIDLVVSRLRDLVDASASSVPPAGAPAA